MPTDYFNNMSVGTLLAIVTCFLGIVGSVSGVSIKVYNIAQRWRKLENEKEESKSALEKNTDDIKVINNKIDTIVQTLNTYIEHDKHDKQAMLRNDIQEIYCKALKNRYMTAEAKKNFGYLYERYTANEGNSYVVDQVYPFIIDLPVFSSEEDAQKYYEENGSYK